MPKQSYIGARSPEYALLGFLYEQMNYGYNLYQVLVTELGHVWHISQSQTYNILKRLIMQGYITSTIQQQEKLPTRQLLQITATGRRRFEEWLGKPIGSSVHAIRLEFITRLYFAQKLYPDRLSKMIDAQTVEVDRALARLETDRRTIPPEQTFNRLSLELRIRQLESIRDWLIECQQAFGIKV